MVLMNYLKNRNVGFQLIIRKLSKLIRILFQPDLPVGAKRIKLSSLISHKQTLGGKVKLLNQNQLLLIHNLAFYHHNQALLLI